MSAILANDVGISTRRARGKGPMSAIKSASENFIEKGSKMILALDLGTSTGWAVRRADGMTLSGVATFKPGRYEGGGMRFLRFAQWLDGLDVPQAIYFEEVRRHAGTDAAHAYGGFLATLGAWCERRSIPYAGIPVGTIKRHATGKGNAGKPEMIAAMRAKGFNPADDNEADALAILLFAAEQSCTGAKSTTATRPVVQASEYFSPKGSQMIAINTASDVTSRVAALETGKE